MAAAFRRLGLDGPPLVLPRLLDRVAERWARWPPRARAMVVVVLVVAALALAGRGAVRSPWGPPVAVLVAARDLTAVQPLTPADVRAAHWPARLVPVDAVDAVDGAVPLGPIPAGAVVTRRHLAADGLGAGLPSGRAAYPLPLEQLPPLLPGQRIDLVSGGHDGDGYRLAAAARVLGHDASHVWLEVARDEAPAIAAAAAFGAVTPVVLPPAAG